MVPLVKLYPVRPHVALCFGRNIGDIGCLLPAIKQSPQPPDKANHNNKAKNTQNTGAPWSADPHPLSGSGPTRPGFRLRKTVNN